jgi:hypothetical protein
MIEHNDISICEKIIKIYRGMKKMNEKPEKKYITKKLQEMVKSKKTPVVVFKIGTYKTNTQTGRGESVENYEF